MDSLECVKNVNISITWNFKEVQKPLDTIKLS